jgi:chromate transporter
MIQPEEAQPKPRSLTDLFVSFTILALQGFGGVHAVVQRELVDRKRWLSREEFIGDWAVAQIMPGANVANLALMIGGRHFGLPGAIAAIGGLLAVPAMLVLLLALAYSHFVSHPAMAGAMRGIGAVTAGIVFSAALRLIGALRGNVLTIPVCAIAGAAAFVIVGVLRLPLMVALAAVGGVACTAAYAKLKPGLKR